MSAPAPSASTAPNPQLDCYAWLTNDGDAIPPFPHRVHPGYAMRFVHDWAEKRHAAKQQSIGFENVHCPKTRCIEPDDCWFHIRLDDAASTAVSHLVSWLDVHAESGVVRWEEAGPDGGMITLLESPKWPVEK